MDGGAGERVSNSNYILAIQFANCITSNNPVQQYALFLELEFIHSK